MIYNASTTIYNDDVFAAYFINNYMRIVKLDNNRKKAQIGPRKKRDPKPILHSKTQISYIKEIENISPNVLFTYNDVNRNAGVIQMYRHQINQAICNYGYDLIYFRKYNTFFLPDEQNKANLIYGEDTTAEFYASGAIRAFVNIDNMAWSFNNIGLEATENIDIYLGIESFEQVFKDRIAKIETQEFKVAVSGNLVNNEVTGLIDNEHFTAEVYGEVGKDLKVRNGIATICNKKFTNQFYKSKSYDTSYYPLTGVLSGKVVQLENHPSIVTGYLKGTLSFYGNRNIENSETWDLAPQVGDYFKFDAGTGIQDKWEITQVYDKNLAKGTSLNPFLSRYVFKMSAVRRVDSFEKNSPELEVPAPGEDINCILGDITKDTPEKKKPDQYNEDSDGNIFNKKTNRLGRNIYDYTDRIDEEYGGVQNSPSTK